VKALSILYHDVVEGEDWDSSGFPGPSAARYKLSVEEFEKHLEAISRVFHSTPVTVFDLLAANAPEENLLLTFDDGGASASRVAEVLKARGWRGHFFVTTDYIGRPAFLDRAQIHALRKSGHVIGSHSCSHPQRMSSCSFEQVFMEWRRSAEMLAEIVGEPITVASVPRGNYSARVARAAAHAGIKFLLTSEPTVRCRMIEGCWILGRYGILQGMSPRSSADFAARRFLPCFEQWSLWNAKKLLKRVGGVYYHRIRDLSLGERSHSKEA
jgi:peptidoglycan/xylan/chitin deacetylase (PgdA/CDA1 family)